MTVNLAAYFSSVAAATAARARRSSRGRARRRDGVHGHVSQRRGRGDIAIHSGRATPSTCRVPDTPPGFKTTAPNPSAPFSVPSAPTNSSLANASARSLPTA